MKRRTFLLGSAAVAGAASVLAIGWAALPQRSRLVGAAPLPAQPGEVALNGWVKLAHDGTVTIVMANVEMGQGVYTGLAMLLADEMDADWSRVRVELAGSDAIYNNQATIVDSLPFAPGPVEEATKHVVGKLLREVPGLAITGGSASIKNLWLPMRQAGAAARAMLIGAAARTWGVPEGECEARDGRVSHRSGREASYGELAAAAALLPLPEHPLLKRPEAYRLIGQPVRRIDTVGKIDGSTAFGIDVMPPGMLYASIRMCPAARGRVARHVPPRSPIPGLRKLVVLEPVAGGIGGVGMTSGGVAAIADLPFQAMQAVAQTQIEWDAGEAAGLSSASVDAALQAAARAGGGSVHLERGDIDRAFAAAARTVEAEYRVPFLAHAAMEPMNCTAQFKDGAATLWVATQMPGFARRAVAKALGIEVDRVTLHAPAMGGAFGRRTFTDCVVQAALLAREAGGAPVQLLWPREEDMAHDYYRPAYAARYRAGLDAQGGVVAWHGCSAGSSLGAPSFLDAASDGAANKSYALPNVRIEHVRVENSVSMGIWRSVHNSQNAFFYESFVDEVASAAKRDPVAMRGELLAGQLRELNVLKRAAELGGWGTPLKLDGGGRQGRGVALHSCFGSTVAQVAEVAVGEDGAIRVKRIVCVIDCGIAVNPGLVKQQLESAVIFGLAAALQGEITFDRGAAMQSNYHDYQVLRMHECPEIVTEIIDGAADRPGGVGEVGTPPVAPAVANAVFAATGQRLRNLPLRMPRP